MTNWFHHTEGEARQSYLKMRECEPEIRETRTQRRAPNAVILRTSERSVFAIDEWLPSSVIWHSGRRGRRVWAWVGVFADTRLGVAMPTMMARRPLDALIRSLTDVPVLPGNERRGAVKKILPVMKIQDGKTARRLLRVTRRRVNDEVALIAKEARAKLFMFAELSGTHGTMVTRRSFASTCWPGVTCSFTMRPAMGA